MLVSEMIFVTSAIGSHIFVIDQFDQLKVDSHHHFITIIKQVVLT